MSLFEEIEFRMRIHDAYRTWLGRGGRWMPARWRPVAFARVGPRKRLTREEAARGDT